MMINAIAIRSGAEAIELLGSVKEHETAAYIATREPAPLPPSVLVAVPDNADQAMEIAETLLRTGTLDIIAVDVALCVSLAFARLLAEARKRDSGLVSVYP